MNNLISRRLLALALVFVMIAAACSTSTSSGDAETAPVEDVTDVAQSAGPTQDDHWHSPYGIYFCDASGEGFIQPLANDNDPDGIHTHADGVIHIHPFNDNATGANATLGSFMVAVGLELHDDKIVVPTTGDEIAAGDACRDSTSILQVARWSLDALDAAPEIFTENLADIVFVADLDVYTIAYLPVGAEIPQPPTIGNLAQLNDVAPEELPDLPDDFDFPGFGTVARVDPPPAGATIAGETPCPDDSSERVTTFSQAPSMCIDPANNYVAVFNTNQGVVRVELDTERTPETANNFVVLSRYGYYDNIAMFRTDTSIDIIQSGGPHSNSASDQGPGYNIKDEGGSFAYLPGDLTMARTAGPDSASAQFFFSAGERTANLDGQGTYVTFGRVIEGLDVLESILALHVDDNSGLGGGPGEPVVIESIVIEES